jgi:hypothetical protein
VESKVILPVNLMMRRQVEPTAARTINPSRRNGGFEMNTETRTIGKNTFEDHLLPLFSATSASCLAGRQLPEMELIDDEEHCEDQRHSQKPHRPEGFYNPKERDSLEISEEEWRIADRRQCTSHVADNKNEEDDVVVPDAIPVDPKIWPDQDHRSAGRSQYIRDDSSNREKEYIRYRLRFRDPV